MKKKVTYCCIFRMLCIEIKSDYFVSRIILIFAFNQVKTGFSVLESILCVNRKSVGALPLPGNRERKVRATKSAVLPNGKMSERA